MPGKPKGNKVVPKPSVTGAVESTFTRWMNELRFTWFAVLLISVVPAVFFGSAIFSVGFLAVAVLFGVPATLLGCAKNGSKSTEFRRLAIMLVVPALTLAYVSKIDEQIPENAMPIIRAIESFRRDTGHYPESLDALIPKHLAELPDVRFSVLQPLITYRIADGQPYLAIPSTMGDMFAQFEYDFATKAWIHHS